MAALGVTCPPAAELQRGGIVGVARVTSIVKAHPSRWFRGPHGLVLAEQRPVDFVPCDGQLGYFQWRPARDRSEPEAALPWMLPKAARGAALLGAPAARISQADLFG
jgi:hypothetical protein